MSEINDLLNPNEKILWKRINGKNVASIYPLCIINIVMILFCFGFLIYPGILCIRYKKISDGIGLILIGIFFQIFFSFLEIYINRKWNIRYQKILNAPKVELKEYKIINVISNQRVIIKDIRGIRAKKRIA